MQADVVNTRHDDTSRWARLLSWLQDKHGMSVEGDGLLVQCRDVPGALIASSSLDEKDVTDENRRWKRSLCVQSMWELFTVPANALINIRTLAAVYPPQAYKKIQDLTAVQQLSLHLLLHRPDRNSDSLDPSYGPYISTLPRDFSSHPLTWLVKQANTGNDGPETEFVELLPPGVSVALEKLNTRFLKDWTVVRGRLNEHPVLLQLSSRLDLDAACVHFPDQILCMDYLWAWLNVNTRCIHYLLRQPATDPDNLTLCPILDFANHNESRSHIVPVLDSQIWGGTPRRTRMGDYSFVSCSGSSIVQGQELFLRYGGHPNGTLFVEYGFVESFPEDALAAGDFRGDVDLQDIFEHMFLDHPLGPQMRDILEDEGYWGDWTIHSSPRPAHPSYRVVMALRLYYAVDDLPPAASCVPDDITESWRNVANGCADLISEENEGTWRNSLARICEYIVNRAQRNVQCTKEKSSDGKNWHGWVQENIRYLWLEELEVALAVAHSVRTGVEF